MKAGAFSNEGWNTHWQANGPAILVEAWNTTHPDIPLSSVAKLCDLSFLCSYVQSPAIEQGTLEGGISDKNNVVQDMEKLQISEDGAIPNTLCNDTTMDKDEVSEEQDEASDDKAVMLDVSDAPIPKAGDDEDDKCDLVALWNDHYNSYYWYYYQQYQGGSSATQSTENEVRS